MSSTVCETVPVCIGVVIAVAVPRGLFGSHGNVEPWQLLSVKSCPEAVSLTVSVYVPGRRASTSRFGVPYAIPSHVMVMQNMLALKVQKSPVSVGLSADAVMADCCAAITPTVISAASRNAKRRPSELALIIVTSLH